jgi:4-hydroxy-3-methylbut-2-enyl diphosphate reductase
VRPERPRLSPHGLRQRPQPQPNVDRRHLSAGDQGARRGPAVLQQGKTIVLIGHNGHEEVDGTFGQAPDRTIVVQNAEEAAALEVTDPENLAFVSQTTLSVDESQSVVGALRKKFPLIVGPTKDDICYASQNRQVAVRKIAGMSDLVLVVGSANSSNSNRMVEVAREAGAESYLVENEAGIDQSWIDRAETIGISSGASTPEVLVDRVIAHLASQGIVELEEVRVATEDIRFPLPASVS